MLYLPVQILSRLYGHVLLVMQHRYAPTPLAGFCLDCLLFDLLLGRVFHPGCRHRVGSDWNCFRCSCHWGKARDCNKHNDIGLDSRRRMLYFVEIYPENGLSLINKM